MPVSLPFSANKPEPPFVYIVGAGPGDPGLVTLKTYDLLQHCADVVVYDRLIPDAILDLIPEGIERIYAGKSCRKHVMTQDEINACLVEQAKMGKVVVRLKGGDPFIFGRGGEEMLYLVEHNIPFEIVPGVNAADGCSAALGIPLTHRGIATGVRFITGHQQKGAPMQLDWQSLADPNTTLVIFMGLAHLEEICNELVAHGLSGETPLAVIQNGTTPKAKHCKTTLANAVSDLADKEFKPPTLVVIGKVVGLN